MNGDSNNDENAQGQTRSLLNENGGLGCRVDTVLSMYELYDSFSMNPLNLPVMARWRLSCKKIQTNFGGIYPH